MPHTPAMPPHDRVFGRLDRFACTCPSCGEVIVTHKDGRRKKPARLGDVPSARGAAKALPHNASVWQLVWNPYTQRLQCPHCHVAYTVGLVFFNIPKGRRILIPPSDTHALEHERTELRRLAGSWYLDQVYEGGGQPVNLAVDVPCSCPVRGWAKTCAVHGDPAAGARGV